MNNILIYKKCKCRALVLVIHVWQDTTLTEITIGDKTAKCLIESGVKVNVTDTCFFNQLENNHITPTSRRIYGYRSTEPYQSLASLKPKSSR